jgi:hypothetical protein
MLFSLALRSESGQRRAARGGWCGGEKFLTSGVRCKGMPEALDDPFHRQTDREVPDHHSERGPTRRLGLRAGDLVSLSLENDRVVLRSVRGGWTESTRGLGAEMWRKEGGAAAIERERDSWK